MTRLHTVIDSPIGPLTLVADDDALAAVYMADQRHRPPEDTLGAPGDAPPFAAASEQFAAYFAGRLRHFDLPLAPVGTPFQRRVWLALRTIDYGELWTYRQLAEEIGRPTAARAVGMANGRNPLSIVVPCHRVVGSGGALVGYGGGLDRKRYLLELEERSLLALEGASLTSAIRNPS